MEVDPWVIDLIHAFGTEGRHKESVVLYASLLPYHSEADFCYRMYGFLVTLTTK